MGKSAGWLGGGYSGTEANMQSEWGRCSPEFRVEQRKWAETSGRAIDGSGYCLDVAKNLLSMSPETRAELAAGDGGELGRNGKRGKLQALHSSTALACNFFEYWRRLEADSRDSRPLREALSLSASITEIKFEQKFQTGVGPKSPNLDVVLFLEDGTLTAVESKFLEPYTTSSLKKRIQEKYFGDERRWSAAGLRGAQRLAEDVRKGEVAFAYVNAPQLLKHMLGLARQQRPWTLLYLWFDPPGNASVFHRAEFVRFTELLGEDGHRVRELTYREALTCLRSGAEPQHSRYLDYMWDRYFPTRPQSAS